MAAYIKKVTLAITGASGSVYALSLLDALIKTNCEVYLLLSEAAEIVLKTECDLEIPESLEDKQKFFDAQFKTQEKQLQVLGKKDWFSPVASGSSSPSAMVICPASGGTISAIAHGASNNLIERAADVALKEKRKLIVVPRETPYSSIHLENMLKLSQLGAVILPASPGFYQKPRSLDDIVNFITARILDQLEIKQDLLPRWGE